MNIIEPAMEALRNKDTIFIKSDSDLKDRYDALNKLSSKYPNNNDLLNELYTIKRGLKGEEEISYQLKKANIGMYVLRDVKVKYNDLSAQIDYIVITPIYIYYIECKNLVGNITVNEKGDFIREFTINGKTIKKGIYSPLRQVEAQRDVIRKIWEGKTNKIIKLFTSKNFEYYRRVLVVTSNHDTILDTKNASKDIKYKILRADNLVRQIKYDLEHRKTDDYLSSNKEMEASAKAYLELCSFEKIDYYEYYKNKFIKDDLKERLILLRKNRAKQMHIPPYYIFTDDELDNLLKYRPKNMEELQKFNILPSIKLNIHGNEIINEINK